MSQSATRRYNFSDAILLAHLGKVLEGLPTDLATFTLEFPMIDQAFVDEFQAAYKTALKEGGDDVVRGQVGEKTQAMADAMEEAKNLIKRLRFWVDFTYKDNPAKRKGFNLRQYWKVAYNQPALIQFMNALAEQVQNNSADLLEKGAKQTLIDGITANAERLATADAQQEHSKSGRNNATQERILALNALYERGVLLDSASDLAFEADPIKVAFYDMPVARPKAEDVE